VAAAIRERYGFTAKEALSPASPVVNLRVTQVVNGVRGVHATLPHGAVEMSGEAG
jgi:acetamidase/formamidase